MTHDDDAAWRRILAGGAAPRAFIGEIARLYAVWVAHGCEPVQQDDLAHWCRQTAARTNAQPDPLLGLHTAEMLGIIERDATGLIKFVHNLKEPSQRADVVHERTPPDLALAILERMADTPCLSGFVSSALDRATVAAKQIIVRWDHLTVESRRNIAWVWIQQLGLGRLNGPSLELDSRLLPFVIATAPSDQQHIGEEELQARLAEQSRRAVLAEEFIVRLEQQRLIALGRPEYAAGVQRVSKYDVAAGYDVLSFNTHGDPQYIEVKSSAGRRSFFFFSRNEMQVAAQFRKSYWLAWMEFSTRLPDRSCPIYWFRDPIGILEMHDSPWSQQHTDMKICVVNDDSTLQSVP